MCGIAGVIRVGLREEQFSGILIRMNAAQRHRGPDDEGVWIDAEAGVGLGHRRLSVVDLSPAGHQPMASHDGRFVMVFNGEIYNHQALRRDVEEAGCRVHWRGHADSETLLEAISYWGLPEALGRAVGQFAIGLWDRQDRVLHLARDRFGEKPLYYGVTAGAFAFASELSALRAIPGHANAIDPVSLAHFFRYGAVPAPSSIFRDIRKLEPATILSAPIDALSPKAANAFVPSAYWSLEGAANSQLPVADTAEIEAALSDAVKLQMLADVPVGAFLSGGIDSSLIAALMQKHSSRPVRTFTIGFTDKSFDESSHAAAVARHLGTDHTSMILSPGDAQAIIPDISAIYAEPFADSSQIPTVLVARLARQHVTAALSGDGGDELFGGYNRHVYGPALFRRLSMLPAAWRKHLPRLVRHVPRSLVDGAGRLAGVRRLAEKVEKVAIRAGQADDAAAFYRSLIQLWPEDEAIVPATLASVPSRLADMTWPLSRDSLAEAMMAWDTAIYLPDDILHKVDRATMSVSLESRSPFLDHRVAEAAWRLPLASKISGHTGKLVLRQILAGLVPASLFERPKTGFALPIGDWLRGPLRGWAESLLSDASLAASGLIDAQPVRRRWAWHIEGRSDETAAIWSVLMFQDWYLRKGGA